MQLEFSDDKPSVVNMVSKPLVFNLEGAVRQVSVAQVDDEGKPNTKCNISIHKGCEWVT